MKTIIFTSLVASLSLLPSCGQQEKDSASETTKTTSVTATEVTSPKGMVLIPGGTYKRGSEGKQDNGKIYAEEAPVHEVTVKAFYMDATEVTNAEFKKFIDATGYKTFAEKGLSKKDFPYAPEEMLKPGAAIFSPPKEKIDPHRAQALNWWPFTVGACWKHPQGPGSSIDEIMDHPVVCINHDDAEAYAKWAGKRLPTEAEWEFAARGGLKEKKYTWGDERKPDDKWMANCFQGSFPAENTKEDGFAFTAPVKTYKPNGFGLYDMAGNVWEMCSDLFHPEYYKEYIKNPTANPTGPKAGITDYEMQMWRRFGKTPAAHEDSHPMTILRVTKGGSFLCHVSYCLRYRPAARHQTELITPTNHTGFRCVKDVE